MVSVPHGSASLPLQFFPKIVCINMSCNRIGSYQIYLYVLVSYKFDASMFAIDCSKQTMFFFIGELLVWNGAGFICLAMWQVKGVSSTFDAVKAISDIRVLVSTDVVLVLPWSCEIESWLACTISYEYRFCNTNSILFRHSSVGYEQYATLSSKAYLTSCITRGSQFVRCSLQEFKASREIAGDLCPIYKLAFLPRKGGEEKEGGHPPH